MSDNEKVEQLEGQLKRALADYANQKKRFEKEKEELIKYSNETLLTRMVHVLDGFEMIMKEFNNVLQEYGFEKISVERGDTFNPEIMEAVEHKDNGEHVTEVFSNAYKLHDKIVNPAKVRVGTIE